MARKRSGKFYFENEKKVMKRFGLKPTKGSGSGWIEKEDGQNDYVIAQLKSTDAQSYRVTVKDIETLEYNAAVAHKIPVFMIEFLETGKVYVLANPVDIPKLAKYIECGEYGKEELEEIQVLDKIEDVKQKPIIKSGNKKKFWKQKEREWEKKCKRK